MDNGSRLVKLMKFFKAKTKEEMMGLSKGDELLRQAYDLILQYQELKELLDIESEKQRLREEAEKEGWAKGMAKGIAKGMAKGARRHDLVIAKKMLEDQADINFISKILDLSIDEITQVSRAIKMLSDGDDRTHIADMTGLSIEELEYLSNDDA
jgi:flagellar biosynthesis/type III secretory pathway protein FliH